MLKITPYLGLLVVIVSVGGLWYPKLGYFLLIVFATLMLVSPFKGRWFCGNLCPRGSFNDFWLGKVSFKKKIPGFLSNIWLRALVFILMMSFMIYRLMGTKGITDKIGMVFVVMCLATTLIAVLFGIIINPRAWCTFCPMGTLQRWFGSKKYLLKVDKNKCINCGICKKICSMQLPVNEILHKPDCIKCGRCVDVCPKNALSF
jgi:ferredoxin-type protein NapH